MDSRKKKMEKKIPFLFKRMDYKFEKMSLMEAREELNVQSELISSLIGITNEAVIISNEDFITLALNEQAAKLLKTSVEEFEGKSFIDLIVPKDKREYEKNFSTFQKGGIVPLFEIELLRKDGKVITVEIKSSIVYDQNEKPKYIINIIRDVSNSKETQEIFKDREGKYYKIFNEIKEGLILIDIDNGKIIDANYEFIRQTKRDLHELQSLFIWEILPFDQQDFAKNVYFEAKEQGIGKKSRVFSLETPDGETMVIEMLSMKITVQNKEYLLSVSRDITEQKNFEKQLQKQRDELESFASSVAHDIRGKLQVISLYNELSENSIYTDKISEQINDMVKFLNSSLLLAKKGDIVSDFSKINLKSIISQIIAKIVSLKPDIIFEVQNLAVVYGDENKLIQVFENLLLNIVKHSQATKVKIYSKIDENNCNIMIEDNGRGMTNEVQEKIRYAWETNIYTTFGLMIVKKIVEAHNGTISFTSTLRTGTCFKVTLPTNPEKYVH